MAQMKHRLLEVGQRLHNLHHTFHLHRIGLVMAVFEHIDRLDIHLRMPAPQHTDAEVPDDDRSQRPGIGQQFVVQEPEFQQGILHHVLRLVAVTEIVLCKPQESRPQESGFVFVLMLSHGCSKTHISRAFL